MFAPPWIQISKLLLVVCDVVCALQAMKPNRLRFVGQNIDAGHLNLCLCASAVPAFLDSNPVAMKVVDELGKDAASEYFAGLVSGSSFIIAHAHDS